MEDPQTKKTLTYVKLANENGRFPHVSHGSSTTSQDHQELKQHEDDDGEEEDVDGDEEEDDDDDDEENTGDDEPVFEEGAKDDMQCGYRCYKPACLQKCNNSKMMLVCICWFVFVQSYVVNGINNVNTATMERRFDLHSSRVAWISSAYDLTGGVVSVFVGYMATFVNKSRMMTWSAAVMTCGSFVMCLPHLLVGPYELGNKVMDGCDVYGNKTMCGEETSRSPYLSYFLYIFILGQCLHGVGGAAAYTIGTPLLDENIQTKDTPLYIGIMHACSALGPAVGFVAGGVCLSLYVDIGRVDVDQLDITPEDPRWVGAWWIGFVASSVAGISVVAFLACFPRELPEGRKYKKTRVSEAYKGVGDKETARSDFGRSRKDIITSFKMVVFNPVWVGMTVGAVFDAGMVVSFLTFLPKIFEFQYGMSPSKAALYSGAIAVPGAVVGQIIGGLIPRWTGAKIKALTLQCSLGALAGLITSAVWLIKCEMPDIAGITVGYSNSSLVGDPTVVDSCNANCSCSTRSYEPICGIDGVQYFSACHAGCVDSYTNPDGTLMYGSCQCLPQEINGSSFGNGSARPFSAVDGVCDLDCTVLKLFLPILSIFILGTFITNTPFHAVTMRCVPDKQRAFAYGLQCFIIRFCGSTPLPVVFGIMFDQACLIWQETCGDSGACWIYDSGKLAFRLFLLTLIVKSISTSCYFLAFLSYKPPAPPAKHTAKRTKRRRRKKQQQKQKRARDDDVDDVDDEKEKTLPNQDKQSVEDLQNGTCYHSPEQVLIDETTSSV